MKVITMLLVIVGHIANMYHPNAIVEPTFKTPFFNHLSHVIYQFHMPAFFAISGAVYYICKRRLGKYTNDKKFIVKKFYRLGIPYMAFALCWVLPCLYLMGKVDTSLPRYIFTSYVVSLNSRHLWYLYTLFFIAIGFHFGEKWAYKHPLLTLVLLLLLNLYAFMLPYYFQLSSIATYFVYYYVGYLFYSKCPDFTSQKAYTIMAILAFIICYLLNIRLQMSLLSFVEALLGTFVLYSLSAHLATSQFARNRFFSLVSRDTFGLYLFHPMLIYYYFFLLRGTPINPYVAFIVCLVLIYALSLMLTALTRSIKLKWLIGE